MLDALLSLFGLDKWLDSLSARVRLILAESVGGLQARALLAKIEWQEQRRILARLVVLAVFCAVIGLGLFMAISLALIVQFWDTPYRVIVAWSIVAGLVFLFLLGACGLICQLRKSRNAFELTRLELNKDLQALKDRL